MSIIHELCWRSRLGGEIDGWGELVAGDQRYKRILILWHSVFPDSMYFDQGEMRPTDLITDAYRMYPVEFYALLDLALWIPFTPRGFRTPRRPIRWEDVQPGHRFQRAVALWKESGRRLTPISSDERERCFDETQEWVAERMGWESPRGLAIEWSEYLTTDR